MFIFHPIIGCDGVLAGRDGQPNKTTSLRRPGNRQIKGNIQNDHGKFR